MSVTRSGCGSVFKSHSITWQSPGSHAGKAMDGGGTRRGMSGCVGPKKTGEREGLEGACGRGGGGETQEEGWEGSRDGWRQDWVFKREGNAVQRPGAPLALGGSGGAGVGTAHPAEPGAFGGSAGGGEGAGDSSWWDSPAPSGLILQPGRKSSPRQRDPAEDSGQLPI